MCHKAIDNYPRALKLVRNYYKTKKMCDKVVNTYHSTIQFVPECYEIQKLCDKNKAIINIILM